MNPAACARAKKELRLAREASEVPETLPATPEDAYRQYREHSRPYRRTFRGVITRKEAERFAIARARKQQAVVQSLEGESL